MLPDEADSEQCTTGGSNPVDPMVVPVVGSYSWTKGSGRVHTGSRHHSSETTNSTLTLYDSC